MLTLQDILGIFGVLATLGGTLGLLRRWQQRRRVHSETVRKALHVLMGMVALSFPAVFETAAPVVWLAGLSLALMLALRHMPWLRQRFGDVLHSVGRRSYGEVCFPVAVCALFIGSGGGGVGYTIPLLLLTFADPAAALVGVRLGRTRFASFGGAKSGEGSLAFFVVALPCVVLPLGLVGTPLAAALLTALAIAGAATFIEAASGRGLDNLLVPLCGFMLLRLAPLYNLDVFTMRSLIAGL